MGSIRHVRVSLYNTTEHSTAKLVIRFQSDSFKESFLQMWQGLTWTFHPFNFPSSQCTFSSASRVVSLEDETNLVHNLIFCKRVPWMKVATDDNSVPSQADMCALVEKFAEMTEDAIELPEDRNTTEPADDVTFKVSPVHVRVPLFSSNVNVAFEVA